MSRTPVRISNPEAKAEGILHFTFKEERYHLPYDTQLAGPDGCAIHFWLREHGSVSGLALTARKAADNYRDIVQCTYSIGQPVGALRNPRLFTMQHYTPDGRYLRTTYHDSGDGPLYYAVSRSPGP